MKLCRGCMDDTKSNLQPFVATDEVFDLFNEITQLNIYLNDGLPNWLCKLCVVLLEKFKAFREQCTNSNTELKLKLGITSTAFVDTKEIKLEDVNYDHDIDVGQMEDSSVTIKTEVNDINGQINKPLYIKMRKKKVQTTKDRKTEYIKHQTFAYRCDDCGRGFHYYERYEGHLREHEGKSAAVCEFCNGEFTSWPGLQKHMNLMHKSEMKYVCEVCGKKFIYESGLISHRSTNHNGPRKHMCEQCGRSFTNGSSLGKHKLSHTDETPYECNICGKKFKCEAHLKAHHFRHMGIKKFSCDICGIRKSFTTRPELKQHMRMHSDIKEFQCSFCHQYFKQKSHLSVHQRSHTLSS